MNLKTVHRLICFLPYYFVVVIIVSYLASKNFDALDPPPPDPDPLAIKPLFTTESLMFRLLVAHVLGLIVYCVILLPVNVILTVLLLRKSDSKTGVVICFIAYLLIAVAMLFCVEFLKLLPK